MASRTDNDTLSNEELSRISFIAGFILAEFVFLLLFLGAIALIAGSTIAAYQAWIALLVSIATPFFLVRSKDLAQRIPPFVYSVVFLGFVAAGLLVSAHFFDVTYDGQAYHQEAIIQLAQGWNPVYETLSPDIAGWIWVTHYSKGAWIAAASLYEMTGRIEHGKLPNLLLIGATFFICASVLLRIVSLKASLAILVSLLLAFNPISAHQSLGFCVDGQLSSLLISLIAVLIYQFFTPSAAARLLTVFLVITLVNVKFTAVPYTLVIGLGFVIAAILWKRLYQLRAVILHASAAFVVGIVVVGYNPYVTNTLVNGNPFYPLIGSGSVDAISELTPPNFSDRNRVERLFLSVFGTTSRDSSKPSELKTPFTIARHEVFAFATPNVKVGGWGPLFGGAMLLTVFGFAAAATTPGALRRTAPYLFGIFIVLATALVHGATWWARFAPQLWLIPVIGAVFLVQTNGRFARTVGYVLLLVLLVNVALVGGAYTLFQNKFTNELSSQLDLLARENAPVDVYFGEMQSNRIRLREAGIEYRDRATPDDLTCPTKSRLSRSATWVCSAAQ